MVEVHRDAVKQGSRVVIVDDLIATGGTILATLELFKKMEVYPVGVVAMVDLVELGGTTKLIGMGLEVKTLVKY